MCHRGRKTRLVPRLKGDKQCCFVAYTLSGGMLLQAVKVTMLHPGGSGAGFRIDPTAFDLWCARKARYIRLWTRKLTSSSQSTVEHEEVGLINYATSFERNSIPLCSSKSSIWRCRWKMWSSFAPWPWAEFAVTLSSRQLTR